MLTLTVLQAWILSVMMAMQPEAPWKATYESTAQAIATEVLAGQALYKNDDGRHTAAVFISLAWFESNFRPDAAGDCKEREANGMCKEGSRPHSFCAFQINESNFAWLGVTQQQVMTDINVCTKAASKIIHKSFKVCSRGKDLTAQDRLNWYAAGGPDCRVGMAKGRHRINKATWIFGKFPVTPEMAALDQVGAPVMLTSAEQ